MNDGVWTYSWRHGRQLETMTAIDGSATWTYAYDKDGLRLSRTDGTTTYNYVYLGGQLKRMTVGNVEIYFSYDSDGSPMSMVYNGITYYYVKNLQGDVVGIVDKTGAKIASYSYDAWGNPLETTVSDSVTNAAVIAQNNPLRYRGYVYDTETGYYYLQSRYYNPATGRFLNADSYTSTGSLLGNNMFAYCLNNPVNGLDPCGTCFHHWRFWEDCDECKGKTVLERINEAVEQIQEVNRQQQELQNEITMAQVQMIQDVGQALVDAYIHSVELEAEAQYAQDMVVRQYKPEVVAGLTFAQNACGVCSLYCALIAANTAVPSLGLSLSTAGKASAILAVAEYLIEKLINLID